MKDKPETFREVKKFVSKQGGFAFHDESLQEALDRIRNPSELDLLRIEYDAIKDKIERVATKLEEYLIFTSYSPDMIEEFIKDILDLLYDEEKLS
jgi:hypothetical protein